LAGSPSGFRDESLEPTSIRSGLLKAKAYSKIVYAFGQNCKEEFKTALDD